MAPDEVVLPALVPRMKKGSQQSSRGIERFDLGELVIVAALAGKSQVFRIIPTSCLDGNDVLDRKPFRSEPFLTAAVLTDPPGS
jgi:hypothetical protein